MSYKLSRHTSESILQDERSEDSFWMEYYPKLQRYCHFLTQNKWDGDDIAQEAFLKAKKYADHKHQLTSALLNKIAYNHWIDILRKRRMEQVEADLEVASNKSMNQLDGINDTALLVLKLFTPKQAIIFLLKEAFQYQAKEIAGIFCTTEMAVKSILHRAKKRLEKNDLEEQAFSLEFFWDEEERELLADLFYHALKDQDPTALIDWIPSLKSVTELPKPVKGNLRSLKTHTPSSTLCMAA